MLESYTGTYHDMLVCLLSTYHVAFNTIVRHARRTCVDMHTDMRLARTIGKLTSQQFPLFPTCTCPRLHKGDDPVHHPVIHWVVGVIRESLLLTMHHSSRVQSEAPSSTAHQSDLVAPNGSQNRNLLQKLEFGSGLTQRTSTLVHQADRPGRDGAVSAMQGNEPARAEQRNEAVRSEQTSASAEASLLRWLQSRPRSLDRHVYR